MSWRGILTLVLLVAAVLSGWSAWRQRVEPVAVAATSTRADYLLRNFELIALDSQGKESFTLRAPQLARNPANQALTIKTPLFLLPDEDGQRWEVRSRTGWVSGDNSKVRLRGNVVANSPPGVGRPSVMKTEQLDVFPDKRKASSAVLVTINGPASTMHGTGMRADLASKRVQFLSKGQMQNDPTRR
jgi:lipopolysaccharide export system protein LptC